MHGLLTKFMIKDLLLEKQNTFDDSDYQRMQELQAILNDPLDENGKISTSKIKEISKARIELTALCHGVTVEEVEEFISNKGREISRTHGFTGYGPLVRFHNPERQNLGINPFERYQASDAGYY